VKPESERYLVKARLTLAHARAMLTVDLTEDAGRAACMAGNRAAEALSFERSSNATKTHKGAHLARDEPSIDEGMRRFRSRTYDMKGICDYELRPDAAIPFEMAAVALEDAERFVNCVAAIVRGDPSSVP
jgi:uncharacterized protein (UPF0332 family)